ETNEAFIRMFCSDMYEFFSSEQEGLAGASIDRIVPFANLFNTVIKTGKDIHKEHYPVKNRLYNMNIFTIEEGEIAGAVITDVTKSETDREQVAKRAREVINKNIATVQNIACLLGEHMVETEQLLNSIAEDYEASSEEDE
ncbi:MAG: [Fe-S]-binding protein, partial [Candidatus Gastranaerophilaceae bacterium]